MCSNLQIYNFFFFIITKYPSFFKRSRIFRLIQLFQKITWTFFACFAILLKLKKKKRNISIVLWDPIVEYYWKKYIEIGDIYKRFIIPII